MNKKTKIIGSILLLIILLIVPNIQATEFQIVKNNIDKQIEKNLFGDEIINTTDIWDLLEFLFALLINLIDLIIDLLRIFVNFLLIPFSLINYFIWAILQILFPH